MKPMYLRLGKNVFPIDYSGLMLLVIKSCDWLVIWGEYLGAKEHEQWYKYIYMLFFFVLLPSFRLDFQPCVSLYCVPCPTPWEEDVKLPNVLICRLI